MARPSKAERLAKVFDEALREYNRAQSAQQDQRRQSVEDRRFVSIPGAMWEGQWLQQFANRPRLEINTIMSAIIRITNEYRNNPITVDFVPKDGSPKDDLADTCDMLYRADFEDSCGSEAVDNAFDEALSGGFGAYRLCAELEDEYKDDEKQRIRFKPIFDADTSVYFDMDAKRQDKSDATRCWVVYSMDKVAFTAQWGQDPASWPKDTATGVQFDWCTPDVVYLAEYYVIEAERVAMVELTMPDETTLEIEAEDLEESQAGEEGREYDEIRLALLMGGTVTKEWTKRNRKVHKYIMSGGGILEDCGYIAGKHIPVIPVYGKRWFIDNIERFMGEVRLAKDVVRLTNMQMSKLAEIAALSAVEKPLLLPEQVAGFEALWAGDNVENNPYLLLNPITDANGQVMPSGPIAYTKPPTVPPAMAALMQLSDAYRREILGSDNQGDEMVSNISAQAVEMIQQRVDMKAFIYMSNNAKARRRDGEVWLSMAQDVYVEEGRRMKGITMEGDAQSVQLAKPMIDEDTGKRIYANDLANADMDVAVDVGPSFTSRRDAMVRTLTSLAAATPDPAKQSILLSMAVMNTQGEGMQDLREYFRKELVAQGVVQPNEEERAAMEAAAGQPPPPDPQAMYLMAEAAKAQAQTGLAVANTAKAEADAEKSRAQTAETLAGIETSQVDTAIKAAQAIGGAVAAGSQPQGL
jgi:hypothetical protein